VANGTRDDGDVQGQMETKTRIFIRGIEEPFIDKTETTGLGAAGMNESVDIVLNRADGCRHIVHTAKDAGAVCAGCQGILCAACASDKKNICSECGRVVCGSCQQRTLFKKEGVVLCPGCAGKVRLTALATAAAVAAAAYFIIVNVLRFLGIAI
jgi:hypothetical protein